MNRPSTLKILLKKIAQIKRMERGKLCQIRQGPRGPYYNHQTWDQGRNVVRYVPREQVTALQAALAGYQTYQQLTQAYAEGIIAQTRQQLNRLKPSALRQRKKLPAPPPKRPTRARSTPLKG